MDKFFLSESFSEEEDTTKKVKSNSINTLKKFYNPGVELVRSLELKKINLKKNNKTLIGQKSIINIKVIKDKKLKPLVNSFSIIPPKINILATDNEQDAKKTQMENNIKEYQIEIKKILNIKFNNLNIENDLERKRKQVTNFIKENEYEIKKMLEAITGIKQEVFELKLKVDYLGSIEKFNESMEYMSLVSRKKLSDEKLVMFRRSTVSREKHIEKISEDVTTKTNIKSIKVKEYEALIKKNEAKKQELKEIKVQLMNHYHVLLSEGKDTRKDGLTWLIKAIWELGFEVMASNLPTFLDEKCITYLFEYSKKDLELNRIKFKISEIKGKIHTGNLKDQLYKTEAYNRKTTTGKDAKKKANLSFIRGEQQKTEIDRYIDNGGQFHFAQLGDLLPNKQLFDEEAVINLKFINLLEEKEISTRNSMSDMKKDLLEYINKEFIVNEYERRYNIPLDQLLCALIGEETINTEIAKQNKMQRV